MPVLSAAVLLLLKQQHFLQFPAEMKVKITKEDDLILRIPACDPSNMRTARRKTLASPRHAHFSEPWN
jgi:hypothetical protein